MGIYGFYIRSCEVNWIDPEPGKGSSGYSKYIYQLQKIGRDVDKYKGFHQPPTQAEYNKIHREL
jgi:hypothetical protein